MKIGYKCVRNFSTHGLKVGKLTNDREPPATVIQVQPLVSPGHTESRSKEALPRKPRKSFLKTVEARQSYDLEFQELVQFGAFNPVPDLTPEQAKASGTILCVEHFPRVGSSRAKPIAYFSHL
jgi:hypothetical protein